MALEFIKYMPEYIFRVTENAEKAIEYERAMYDLLMLTGDKPEIINEILSTLNIDLYDLIIFRRMNSRYPTVAEVNEINKICICPKCSEPILNEDIEFKNIMKRNLKGVTVHAYCEMCGAEFDFSILGFHTTTRGVKYIISQMGKIKM